MADNKEAMKKINDLIKDLNNGVMDFVDFVDEFEIICFNEVSSRHLDNFADGWSKATVSSFMKICLRAFDGDEKAGERLVVDLGLEPELEIRVVQA